MLLWKLRKCQISPFNQNLSSVYFSYAKFQLVSCDPSLAIIWQMTYTHKLPKLFSHLKASVKQAAKTCNLFCNIEAKRVQKRCCATDVQICQQPDLVLDRFDVGDRTHNIVLQLVLQQCCQTSCMFFVARFSVP